MLEVKTCTLQYYRLSFSHLLHNHPYNLHGISVLGSAFQQAVTSNLFTLSRDSSIKKKKEESMKDESIDPGPKIPSRTVHPRTMRKWARACPPVGMGGAATPLVLRNSADRARFVRRLEEEGARVAAHVSANIGVLEVTPLQVILLLHL